MTVHWKAEIDIREIWNATQNGSATISDLLGEILSKFKALKKRRSFMEDEMLDEFIERFEELMNSNEDEEDRQEQFDDIWADVYDWADEGHRLWIRTI